jgi:hypothetical protein
MSAEPQEELSLDQLWRDVEQTIALAIDDDAVTAPIIQKLRDLLTIERTLTAAQRIEEQVKAVRFVARSIGGELTHCGRIAGAFAEQIEKGRVKL